MGRWRVWAVGLISAGFALVAFASCGGSKGGGTGGGGTGGGGTGGSECGDDEGIDCVCGGELYGPSCVNGSWDCGVCNECGPGSGGLTCGAGEFCGFDDGKCGQGVTGVCQSTTAAGFVCDPDPDAFVCGCDGQLHANVCDAFDAGVDLPAKPACPIAADQFYCQATVCRVGKHWCNDTYYPGACVTDPGCNPLTCACVLSHVKAGCTCAEDPNGGITVKCPP